MNYGPLLFLGVFLTLTSSWVGLVLIPHLQFGRLEPTRIEETGELYPVARSGIAEQGRELYRAYGCVYCHSQQVRGEDFGADIQRGWGRRRSVARDYIRDKPVLLGTMRTGPDLTNIGVRQPSVSWHLTHLYTPEITSKGSVMPPYRFLFETRKVGLQPSPDALPLTGVHSPGPGYEVVPKTEAKALVAYLLSLKANTPLPEAK